MPIVRVLYTNVAGISFLNVVGLESRESGADKRIYI